MLPHDACISTASISRLSNFRPEGMRVPFQAVLDRPLPVLLVQYIIEAVHAIAQVAELAVRKTIAVQLQTLRLSAVAGLPGSDPVCLQIRDRVRGRWVTQRGDWRFGWLNIDGTGWRNCNFRVDRVLLRHKAGREDHHLAVRFGGRRFRRNRRLKEECK